MSSLIIPPKEYRSPPFCDCSFPTCVDVSTYKGDIHELVKCQCGEEDSKRMEWQWEHGPRNTDCEVNGPNITFHPVYSQGTSIIRGNKRLEPKMIHYWEMRAITSLCGTDVMFGIGTDKVDLNEYQFYFVSALGLSDQSWGFSYRGLKQHRGVKTIYGNRFSQGCLVGIYLDLNRGYLEFFVNRRSLGIAYSNIPTDPNVKIYPMVCSTAAKSAIRLINSTSQKDCLQLHAFRSLSRQPKSLNELRHMPGLKNLIDAYWFLAPSSRYCHRSKKNDLSLEDEVVISLRKSRKLKYKDDDADIDDLYSNAHKIAMKSESDDEFQFDEESDFDGLYCLL